MVAMGLKFLWTGSLAATVAAAGKIIQARLEQILEMRGNDSIASESVFNHYQCSWDEAQLIFQNLTQDMHRKVEVSFSTEDILEKLECCEDREEKIKLWHQLTVAVFGRMLAGLFTSILLQYLTFASMAIVSRHLYIHHLFQERTDRTFEKGEDLSSANRAILSLSASFVQHGSILLIKAIQNSTEAIIGKIPLTEKLSVDSVLTYVSRVIHELSAADGR